MYLLKTDEKNDFKLNRMFKMISIHFLILSIQQENFINIILIIQNIHF